MVGERGAKGVVTDALSDGAETLRAGGEVHRLRLYKCLAHVSITNDLGRCSVSTAPRITTRLKNGFRDLSLELAATDQFP